MTWWSKLAIVLLVFSAVVFTVAGILERDLKELLLAACVAVVAGQTWRSAPRRSKPRA